jgi:hypothetical protein
MREGAFGKDRAVVTLRRCNHGGDGADLRPSPEWGTIGPETPVGFPCGWHGRAAGEWEHGAEARGHVVQRSVPNPAPLEARRHSDHKTDPNSQLERQWISRERRSVADEFTVYLPMVLRKRPKYVVGGTS